MPITQSRSKIGRSSFLPNNICYKVLSSKDFVHGDLEVVGLIVVNVYPDRTIFCQQVSQEYQPRPYHPQPLGMFKVVVVMLKGRAGVVRRVYVDTLHTSCIERQQRLEGFQVVTL